MKALDEYIVMVLFVLLLKRVHFLAKETSGYNIELDELNGELNGD